MHRGIGGWVLAAVAGMVALGACSDSSTVARTGRLTVQLTDAPFPSDSVARVDVYIVRIDARTAAASDSESADTSLDGGWTTIATPDRAINLLDLQGGVTTNLGTASLPVGTYNAFRLILNTDLSSVTLVDGSTPAVKWPSAGQTGLKIYLDAPVAVLSDSQAVVLDFDVSRSFVMRGRSISQNGLLFKPVIHAVARELTGGASGSVVADSEGGAAVAGATIQVLRDGSALDDTASADIVRTTVSDAQGMWQVNFLLPMPYVVRAIPPDSSGLDPALLVGGLTVTSANVSAGNVIILPKSP